MTDEQKETIRKLWKAKANYAEIAEVMGYEPHYIGKVMRDMGLPCNRRTEFQDRMEQKFQDAAPLIIEGKYSHIQIAQIVGCSRHQVTKFQKRLGLKSANERKAEYREKVVLERYGELNDGQLAAILNCTSNAIYGIRKKHGIKAQFGPKGKRI